MIAVLVEVASVVVANAHNPSILNHDWLVGNLVLPDVDGGWELAEPPFTTPPLSSIQYQNSVRILLEPARLTITAQTLGSGVVANPDQIVGEVSRSYVSILEHIPYGAIGNNFKAMIECDSAQRKLVEIFGGNGPWKCGLDSLSAKLTHSLKGNCERHIELAAGEIRKFEHEVSESGHALLMSANYHRNTPSKDEALLAIGEMTSDLQDFLAFASGFSDAVNG